MFMLPNIIVPLTTKAKNDMRSNFAQNHGGGRVGQIQFHKLFLMFTWKLLILSPKHWTKKVSTSIVAL